MKLTISFSTNFSAIDLGSKSMGLNFLDQARKESGVKNLNISSVQSHLCYNCSNPAIELPEEIARKSGHFADTPHFRVSIQKNGVLNEFVSIGCDIRKNDTTGEVIVVYPKWVFDEQAVIAQWEKDGFPSVWGGETE